jgi:DNA-binding NtrC family response regulator
VPEANVLIIDDEKHLAQFTARFLQSKGFAAFIALDAQSGLASFKKLRPELVLLDLGLPDGSGTELLTAIKDCDPETAIIVVTGNTSTRSAATHVRLGADDYLTKPIDLEELLAASRSALEWRRQSQELQHRRANAVGTAKDFIRAASSEAMQAVQNLAARAAAMQGIVLLTGESGTGKDHLAAWIHQNSPRRDGPFFSLNCAALTRELTESELFGHEAGAFTGTKGRKRGLLELANHGTLVLNEIGELALPIQSKLLTFLDTRSFLRVGGETKVSIDARIIAATNRDLAEEVRHGGFRADLYYRLNVFPIELPPLRKRLSDLPVLVTDLLDKLTGTINLAQRPTLSREAQQRLLCYDWPGNIRELRNALERAIMLTGGGLLDSDSFCLSPLPNRALDTQLAPSDELVLSPSTPIDFHAELDATARRLIQRSLKTARTRQEAAALLGLSRHALAYQIKRLGMDQDPDEQEELGKAGQAPNRQEDQTTSTS